MTAPSTVFRVDWANTGTFGSTPYDTVSPLNGDGQDVKLVRGASADLSTGEALGELTFLLDNASDQYTPDRQWHDNPSFEFGTTGWSALAVSTLTAAATSISQVTDNYTGATGTKAGEAVLTATSGSGVTYAIPYRFRNGATYSFSAWLKSTAGTLNVRCGLASGGTPANIGNMSASTITTGWVLYSGTFTPTADRTDVVFFVHTTSANSATVRIDGVQVNASSTLNTFLEAPTKGQLVPGRPVHFYATYSGTDYPKFYGFIDRLTPHPSDDTVEISCYDVARKMSETDIVVGSNTYVSRSVYDFRTAVLEDYERGNINLLPNPAFLTDTSAWTITGGSLTRITTDGPGTATTCGEYVAGTKVVTQPWFAAIGFNGQVYRASAYVRKTAGTGTVTLSLYHDSTLLAQKSITATTTWQRVDAAGVLDSDWVPKTTSLTLEISAGGTTRIGNAAVTRGEALYAYADTGSGRYPNLCANGSFDGQALSGWYDSWSNWVLNPSFETNTSGWSVAGDSFTTASTSITRVAASPQFGVARADIVTTAGGQGAFYAITGTFVAGRTYDIGIYAHCNSGTRQMTWGIGSQAHPTELATHTDNIGTSFSGVSNSWTPGTSRSDVHFFVYFDAAQTYSIDGVSVFLRDSTASNSGGYVDTGPGGAAPFAGSTPTVSTTTVKYGGWAHKDVVPATANVGRIYDFNHAGIKFVGGVQYVVSVWLNGIGAYKVGIAADLGDGTFEDSNTTGTSSGWTQATFNYTPAADRATTSPWKVVLYVLHTAASGVTFYIDGVRVIPGSTADDFEMTQWDLDPTDEASDLGTSLGVLTGNALTNLSTLNGYSVTRHWFQATMATPWFTYKTEGRTAFAAKSASDTFTEDVQGWDNLDIDRAAIINVVPVSTSGTVTTAYYSDETSVAEYGVRPISTIGSALFLGSSSSSSIGNAILNRYKQPPIRPSMTIQNQFPSQLTIDLNDDIAVTIARFNVQADEFVVLREELTISDSGNLWSTVYQTESYPY